MSLQPLTDDEAALYYRVSMHGSSAYPVQKVGKSWQVGPFRSWLGMPTTYATKRKAVAAFERWEDLAGERWAAMKRLQPGLILTAVGVRV